ncbi:fumarate/nitrate reduction transcriptional regulator Fnr [Kushneria phosphatilytica]|uniref:Fumarate/nitrate reduction transcriptional regulator Fnr n=1 Tax=Kushneria phosphatilytica TaxID=657387 RepID=A0A1S1NTD0_9GAMM|nr:fumarate/nitrate reduction transcriptional regulator Fnr [Kushneria phosphatilytica]OHV10030.1 Crp/Fnr family transcriptional regulator [Kushneria phosphatilytica]QEL11714.1 fumarate/nitrate reduction transcriptional regulator Fnr [Kushneria phosphatilytica]
MSISMLESQCWGSCQTCSLSSLCLPLALCINEMKEFDAIITRRRAPLVRGENLCRQGESFTNVFAVRSGSFKQIVLDEEGEEQISHFYLPGELIGLESIDEGHYPGFVVALGRSSVCEIPFQQLDTLAERIPSLRQQLYRSISRGMNEDRHLIRLLTCKSAEERIASFFLDLGRRFRRSGFAFEHFRLPMSRTDIGSHLGLALETVSRVLGRLQQQGVISLHGRELQILRTDELYRLSEKYPSHAGGMGALR